MREDQGNGVGDVALLVNVVNVQRSKPLNVDIASEHRKLVDFRFCLVPVKAVPPVRGEALNVGKRGTIIPACAFKLVGKADQIELLAEKVELRLGHRELEGLLFGGFRHFEELVRKSEMRQSAYRFHWQCTRCYL